MSHYKLTYFNNRGRGEVARYMFALKGVEYDDVRVDRGKEWATLKPKTPFGQLPLLEVDGEVYCQSTVIERLLAKRFGLYGKTEAEQTRTDMVVACINDMLTAMIQTLDGTEELKKKCEEEVLPSMFANFVRMISADGFFFGKQMMWPDLSLAHILTLISPFGLNVDYTKYEKLSNLKTKVENTPAIAEWLKARPENDF